MEPYIPPNYVFFLPRGYISWSAMDKWERNPEGFKQEYFFGSDKLDTKYLRFGKWFAELVEDYADLIVKLGSKELAIVELSERHNLDANSVNSLVKLDVEGTGEYKMFVKIRGVQVLSFIDKYRDDLNVFREYKTGKHPWTQAKVQKHGQLVFYAAGLRTIKGQMPGYCDLDWIETMDNVPGENDFWARVDKKPRFSGRDPKTFRRYFDIREVESMENRIVRNAYQISEAYKAFLNTI